MSGVLVSIITVSFNSASTIEETIKSVAENKSNQTEYIIVDGGSVDGTINLIYENNQNIDRWISESDLGIYDAMNKGVSMSSGKWILFLGSDDTLSVKISDLETTFLDQFHYYGDVLFKSSGLVYDGKFSRYKLFQKNICQQSIFYYADLLRAKKFDLRYKIASDYEMNLFIFGQRELKIKYVNKIISVFNDSGVSSKSTDSAFKADFNYLFFKNFPAYYYPIYMISRIHYYVNRFFYYLKIFLD